MPQLSIKGKIIALISTAVLAIVILTATGLSGIRQVGEDGREIRDNYLASIVNLSQATEALYSLVIAGKNHIVSPSDEVMFRLEDEMRDAEANARRYLAAFEETLDPGEETELFREFYQALEAYMQIHERVRTLSADNDDVLAAEISGTEGAAAFARLEQLIEQMLANNIAGADQSATNAESHYNTTFNSTLLVAVLAVTVLVGGAVIGFGPVLRRISVLVGNMKDIAEGEGDLRSRLTDDSKDEIGELSASFNLFVGRIQELVSEVGSATHRLASAATQMKSTSDNVSQATSHQQREVEQVTTAMDEMNSTVKDIARNAEDASKTANEASEETNRGQQVVNRTIEDIDLLANEVGQAGQVIQQLARDSENIGSILDVIRGIAEQTNLLALNAAIEAARAGEQGRGFAVVADEVRTLASRTQASTQEIQTMIEQLQRGAADASEAMNRGQQQTQQVVDLARSAGEALGKITGAVATITDMNYQIAASGEEQSAVTEEINRNMVNIHTASAQTSGEIAQSHQAAGKLESLAEELQSLVGRFRY